MIFGWKYTLCFLCIINTFCRPISARGTYKILGGNEGKELIKEQVRKQTLMKILT